MLIVSLPRTQIFILSGTQTMDTSTTHTRLHSVENGRGKIKKKQKTSVIQFILEATLLKEGIKKEW